jgi:hypothetical protein
MRRPLASASARIFVFRPPRERPTACFCSPTFSARCRAVCFDVSRIDHLRVRRTPVSGESSERVFPNPSPCPPHESVVSRRVRPVPRRAILSTAAAPEHVHDPADHPAIVLALDATYISRQVRSNSSPLLTAQPKQILAHDPDPFPRRTGSTSSARISHTGRCALDVIPVQGNESASTDHLMTVAPSVAKPELRATRATSLAACSQGMGVCG